MTAKLVDHMMQMSIITPFQNHGEDFMDSNNPLPLVSTTLLRPSRELPESSFLLTSNVVWQILFLNKLLQEPLCKCSAA